MGLQTICPLVVTRETGVSVTLAFPAPIPRARVAAVTDKRFLVGIVIASADLRSLPRKIRSKVGANFSNKLDDKIVNASIFVVNRDGGHGKISTVTIIPGYDDPITGHPPPRLVTDHWCGEARRVTWQQAIAAVPDYALISMERVA